MAVARFKMKKNGFTLVELLVTMTIIAVLAGLALVSFSGARSSSRDGRRKADLEQIKSALEMYRADNPGTGYPASLDFLQSGGYIQLPRDPVTNNSYSYSGGGATYSLCATLEVGGNYCLTP